MSHLGSALAHAVLAKNRPLASFLLADAGVDPNEPRMYGCEPPIVQTVHLRLFKIMDLLMKHGAQVEGTPTLLSAMTSDCKDVLHLDS